MVVVIGVEVSVDDAGQAALEAAQGFGCGVACGEAASVVGLADAVEAHLRRACPAGVTSLCVS